MAMEDNATRGVPEGERRGELEMEDTSPVQGSIAFKGTRDGLLLTLEPETPFSDLLNALAERLAQAPAFFRGASLIVDTSRRALRSSEYTQLEKVLAYYQMSVTSLEQEAPPSSYSVSTPVSQYEVKTITLPPAELTEPIAPTDEIVQRAARESFDTLFLRRTVRSGQAIHHASNIVVLGDVNPGAEIVAGGDIIVWGTLRGMVHAGYPENEGALVCALQLSPVQLRIGHLLSRPPDGIGVQPHPEVARIREGQIVVESWTNGRPSRR